MTAARDPRLAYALDALRGALGCYLHWLQQVWAAGAEGPPVAGADVDRLLAAAGARHTPTRGERRAMAETLAAMAAAEGGPLAAIAAALDLAPGDELTVAAAWWAEADPQFATILGCAHDDGGRRYPTAALLRLVLAPFGIAAAPAVEHDHPLARHGVVDGDAGPTGPIVLTPTARSLLAGGTGRERPPREGALPPRLAGASRALAGRFADPAAGERSVTVLRGREGSGRRALVREAAAATGRVLVTDVRPTPELRLRGRLGGCVVVTDDEHADEVVGQWDERDGPLVVVAPPDHRSPGSGRAEIGRAHV